MNKKIILSVYHTKNPFETSVRYDEYQDFYDAKIRNFKGAVKKLKKQIPGSEILISKNSEKEKLFCANIKRYEGFTCRAVLPVIEKICRQTAEKYKLSLPFEEIYIMASPQVACAMVLCLVDISKVFTVISPQTPFMNLYDEIYFKHGTIIRHLPQFNASVSKNSLIIKCTDEKFPIWSKIPVIDMCTNPEITDFTLEMKNIFISDERIKNIQNVWNGNPGIELYGLFDLIPSEKSMVDINKRADKIFLLDTEHF